MSIVLFTSEEEANMEGYVLLSSNYYPWEPRYEKEDITVEIDNGSICMKNDTITTEEWDIFHCDDLDYFTCEHCNEFYSNRNNYSNSVITWRNGDMEEWCDDCRDNDAQTCDSDLYSIEEMERRGWHYSESREEYTFSDEDSDCLQPYHTDYWNDKDNTNTNDNLRFGMEFEKMELCGDLGAHEQFREYGWRTEMDCTVEWEYITPILSLDRIEDSIDWIKSTWQTILDASISNKCGWHIHISSKKVDEVRLFDKLKYFMPLFWALYPERARNSYSSKPSIWWRGALSDYRSDIQCHTDLGTTEIRIFPWCRWEKTLRFRLMLTKLIVSEAEKWAIEDGNIKLDIDRDKGSFRRAVNFIRTSEELMQVLVQVYDNIEKINSIVTRIIPSFNEAIESCNENYRLTSTSIFAKKLEKFCEGKESVNNNP